MKHKGPILTLVAGVAIAAVLLVLNLNATAKRDAAASAEVPAGARLTPTPTPTATVSVAAPVTVTGPANATYAGNVNAGGGSVAIVVKGAQAIAYFCDGKKIEAWLQGTAVNGRLDMHGGSGSATASLSASYATKGARGEVSARGGHWSFAVASVKPPSGLYRSAAKVRAAEVVGGWIVLADGRQVGMLNRGTSEEPAPLLDLTALSTVIDGTTVAVNPIDVDHFQGDQ